MNPIASFDSSSVMRKPNLSGAKIVWIHSSVVEIESVVVLVLQAVSQVVRMR